MEINELEMFVGEVIVSIEGLEEGSEMVSFYTASGKKIDMLHYQDCCEMVDLNDFECDIADVTKMEALVISATEVSESYSEGETMPPELEDAISYRESCTWTFYKIETTQGGIWLRWLGASNGYYSEDVSIKVTENVTPRLH